jgi:hypothetical protein
LSTTSAQALSRDIPVPAANARLANATARPEVRHEQDQRRQQSSNVKHDLIGGYTLPLHRQRRSHDRYNGTLRKRGADPSRPVAPRSDQDRYDVRHIPPRLLPQTTGHPVRHRGEFDATASIQPVPKAGAAPSQPLWRRSGTLPWPLLNQGRVMFVLGPSPRAELAGSVTGIVYLCVGWGGGRCRGHALPTPIRIRLRCWCAATISGAQMGSWT